MTSHVGHVRICYDRASRFVYMVKYISAPIKYLSRIYLVIRAVIRAYTNAEFVFSDVF